jgi:hypothetical protein
MPNLDEWTFAQRAASAALPYADALAGRYASIAHALRDGHDNEALAELGASTHDLEAFLAFLVLIQDCVATNDPDSSIAVRDYHEQIVGILEGLQPALGHADLVEVADALEDDLVPSLRDYRALDTTVQTALVTP